jgi:hypothetical protein
MKNGIDDVARDLSLSRGHHWLDAGRDVNSGVQPHSAVRA